MNYAQRAAQLREETIAHRRYFHANAEIGLHMPDAQAYVLRQLRACGIDARPCGHGVRAEIGKGGCVFLLRADMDALPMQEKSGEAFACPGGAAHACGHDLHAAMLLTCAKMLKENEGNLRGTVRLMFQTGEETFEGAKDMINSGILEHPPVSAALAFHVAPGRMPVGMVMYNDTGVMMNSVDGFRITVRGRGAHGAYPHSSVDPINIAVHIYLALEAIIAREADPQKSCVMTIGRFAAGDAANIIPDSAVLEGTIRTNDQACRALLVRRMQEAAERTAAVYGGTAEITMTCEVPPLVCNPELTREIVGYISALDLPGAAPHAGICTSASEDFAAIATRVPAAFVYLSAGYPDERGDAPAHNPKVRFNEDVLPIGSAYLAHCATAWLHHHGSK